jgi:hypothetical protein
LSSAVSGYLKGWRNAAKKVLREVSNFGGIVPSFFLTRRSLLVQKESACVVLWRPEALDCRMSIPPEAWTGLAPHPLSLGFEPRASCIRADPSANRATGATHTSPCGHCQALPGNLKIALCVSSLRRGRANLLCIVPTLTDDPRGESTTLATSRLSGFLSGCHVRSSSRHSSRASERSVRSGVLSFNGLASHVMVYPWFYLVNQTQHSNCRGARER